MPINNIPILMYHSIEKMPKSTVMQSLYVSPKLFDLHMSLLNMLGYKGLSLKELNPYLNGEKKGKVVGITFDDGYQNNLTNAAPILKKYDFSATCYLVSQRIGASNVWDLKKGITQLPLMTHSDIQKWLNLGLDIGAHTQTHPYLDELDKQQLTQEIFNCKSDLETMFKLSINDFCYPFGRFNESIVDILKQAGYTTATTMIRGRARPHLNKLTLPRVHVTNRTLMHLFLAKILTKYEDRRCNN